MSKPSSSLVLRVALGAVLFLPLAGPGAGNVGGCGNSPPVIDAAEHCRARQEITCRRELFAQRINEQEFAECSARIETPCMGATWPTLPDGRPCQPTPAESDACITLLGNAELVSTPTDQLLMMFGDCNLCT